MPKQRTKVYRTNEERRKKNEIMSFIEKIEFQKGDTVQEKIVLDFYSTLVRTPSCRISLQNGDYYKSLLRLYFTDAGNTFESVNSLTDSFYQSLLVYFTSIFIPKT